jgi:hypothetical protein
MFDEQLQWRAGGYEAYTDEARHSVVPGQMHKVHCIEKIYKQLPEVCGEFLQR